MQGLPTWALDIMAACATEAGNLTYAHAIDALRNEHLFEETQETVWYGQYPTMIREQPHSLKAPELWKPVDLAEVKARFSAQGELAKLFQHYEPRAGQVAMAEAIAETLNNKTFLLAEAGTGVGKSLAYLVPCGLWALKNDQPIVISTNTRNLQSQLIAKDIPLVRKLLKGAGEPGQAFDACVLKGRNNYLCLQRFEKMVDPTSNGYTRLEKHQLVLFADFVAWAARTKDGDLETFKPEHAPDDQVFIRTFGCRGEDCAGKKCRFYKRCFLFRARQRAVQAHLVIVNHALLFADLVSEGKLLPPHAQIVFDEAHHVTESAGMALSERLSPTMIFEFCQLFAPSKGHEEFSLSQRYERDFIRGHVQDKAEQMRLISVLGELQGVGRKLSEATKDLFGALYVFFEQVPATVQAIRFRCQPDSTLPPLSDGTPQYRREVCLSQKNFVEAERLQPEAKIESARMSIHAALGDAHRCLQQLLAAIDRRTVNEQSSEVEHAPYAELKAKIEGMNEQIDAFAQTLDVLLAGKQEHMVYWIERLEGKKKSKDVQVAIEMAPLDVASKLKQMIYDAKASVIFSSATLKTGRSFEHIRAQLGLSFLEANKVREFVAESPFNYPEQCRVVVPNFLPSIESENYVLELSRLLYALIREAKGRTLVLFTSYDMMTRCAQQLTPHLTTLGIALLQQSAMTNRHTLTETFRANDRPYVLFGTQSFWEGVDITGDALSCVVLARLPFENPSDPVFNARKELVEARGNSSFFELTLPPALIKFRQGVGRLIRSRTDKGLILVADTRVLTASYGTLFAQALPVTIERKSARNEVVSILHDLLN